MAGTGTDSPHSSPLSNRPLEATGSRGHAIIGRALKTRSRPPSDLVLTVCWGERGYDSSSLLERGSALNTKGQPAARRGRAGVPTAWAWGLERARLGQEGQRGSKVASTPLSTGRALFH